MGKHRIQRRNYKITNTYHTKKRYHTTTGSKFVKTPTNHYQRNHVGRTHQPIKRHPHKIPQANRNEPHNQNRRSEDANETRLLPHSRENQTNTISTAEGCEKRTRPTNKIRKCWKIGKKRGRLLFR